MDEKLIEQIRVTIHEEKLKLGVLKKITCSQKDGSWF